ncbi:hypothetical protein [Streptomyces odontomachi]|uniref:hypothetical protein n=1 Tax=Streptomyces odontomachi TaxID=2944940 RepID=UPI0021090DD5|nr:hypothetical protein [Streptomyces sp. ODS25]
MARPLAPERARRAAWTVGRDGCPERALPPDVQRAGMVALGVVAVGRAEASGSLQGEWASVGAISA